MIRRQFFTAQKRSQPESLAYYERKHKDRDIAISAAYASGGYSMKDIGEYFGLHYSRISRIINNVGKAKDKTPFAGHETLGLARKMLGVLV